MFVSDAASFIGEKLVKAAAREASVGTVRGSYRNSDDATPKVR